jgi:mycothiol S-conjugate amidase
MLPRCTPAMTKVHAAMLEKYGESPFSDEWLARPSQDHRITTRIDIAEYLYARTGALKAHATQIDPTAKWWFGLDDDELAVVYPWEDWVLAASAIDQYTDGYESDIFYGVRYGDRVESASH